MEKAPLFFVCRLQPPRPDFPQSMTEEEGKVMREHAAYWATHLEKGTVIVVGPVADPAGVWGLGVVRVGSEDEVRAFTAADPAIVSGLGFRYEILPMLRAMVRG
jgi:uncharacterized protein YciI